jgi:2-polyprenyl-3-methyl-5-hydroxy-6-metoxy-1,4-benzoquinol methylase
MENYWKQENCLVCDAKVEEILDLGKHALANALLEKSGELYESYNLGLSACRNCSHSQLSWMINPDTLFRNYLYASGTSKTLNNYFSWLAKQLASHLSDNATVLDIASNDGSFLNHLNNEGLIAEGIDPADNLTGIANEKGLNTIRGYFPADMPSNATYDCITAMNVAAHNPNPQAFFAGVKKHLGIKGVAMIQVSQANMLGRGEFDTVYHEHYSFFTPASMSTLALNVGLKVIGKELVSVHGDSMVYLLTHIDNNELVMKFNGEFCLPYPENEPDYLSANFFENSVSRYDEFSKNARKVMSDTHVLINNYRDKGYQIALIGVAAKAMTFIGAAELEFDLYLDEAELKVGRFIPGATTPIQPFASVCEISGKTVFFIGAWNFATEIKRKVEETLGGNDNSQKHIFISAFPELGEV